MNDYERLYSEIRKIVDDLNEAHFHMVDKLVSAHIANFKAKQVIDKLQCQCNFTPEDIIGGLESWK